MKFYPGQQQKHILLTHAWKNIIYDRGEVLYISISYLDFRKAHVPNIINITYKWAGSGEKKQV